MRLALGTIDVSDEERRAVNFAHGNNGLATRETMRRYLLAHGRESISFQIAAMRDQQRLAWRRGQPELSS